MARSTIDRATRRIGGTVAEPLQDTLLQISSRWLLCTLVDAYSDVVTTTVLQQRETKAARNTQNRLLMSRRHGRFAFFAPTLSPLRLRHCLVASSW